MTVEGGNYGWSHAAETAFEVKPEGSERTAVKIPRQDSSGRGNTKCKSPEAGLRLMCSKKSHEASVAKTE